MTLTLSLDLDGTIMNNPIGSYIFPKLVDHFQKQNPSLAADHIVRRIHDEWHAGEDGPLPSYLALDWQLAAERVAKELGVRYEFSWEQLTIEGCSSPYISQIDDAAQVLEQLRRLGVRFVVATMGLTKYQRPVLQALGLWDFFDDFLSIDTTGGYYKTDAGFWSALRPLPHVAHCGDSYRHDVIGAGQCGIPVIWKKPTLSEREHAEPDPVRRATLEPSPDGGPFHANAVIHHLGELPQALEGLNLL